MAVFDERAAVYLTILLVLTGVFLSAFAAFYFVRVQKYRRYGYAFKKLGSSAREKAVILLMYLIGYALIVISFFAALSTSG